MKPIDENESSRFVHEISMLFTETESRGLFIIDVPCPKFVNLRLNSDRSVLMSHANDHYVVALNEESY